MIEQIWERFYKVPTPKSFTIGDPDRLLRMESGEAKRYERESVFHREKIAKTWKSVLRVRKQSIYQTKLFLMFTFMTCHKDYIDAYRKGLYYPDSVKQNGFNMLDTDKDYVWLQLESHKSTGDKVVDELKHATFLPLDSDGIYGWYRDCVKPFGFFVEVSIPIRDDPEYENNILECLSEVFDCPAILQDNKDICNNK